MNLWEKSAVDSLLIILSNNTFNSEATLSYVLGLLSKSSTTPFVSS